MKIKVNIFGEIFYVSNLPLFLKCPVPTYLPTELDTTQLKPVFGVIWEWVKCFKWLSLLCIERHTLMFITQCFLPDCLPDPAWMVEAASEVPGGFSSWDPSLGHDYQQLGFRNNTSLWGRILCKHSHFLSWMKCTPFEKPKVGIPHKKKIQNA